MLHLFELKSSDIKKDIIVYGVIFGLTYTIRIQNLTKISKVLYFIRHIETNWSKGHARKQKSAVLCSFMQFILRLKKMSWKASGF